MPSRRAELAAAGITDPVLRAGYARCRELFARHGRTYYLATTLLPPDRRPAVHALYGFARLADEIVDDLTDADSSAERAARLTSLSRQVDEALSGGTATDPVLAALAHTTARYGIDRRHVTDFLAAMRMDTEVVGYATMADLDHYMHGSAAVIGLQMLPVLGTVVPRAEAEPCAAALGVAFQLTNFLRDVGEDLDRGRVYLPEQELAAFDVDRELLVWCRSTGSTDARVRAALAHLVAYTREVYTSARPGLAMLEPASQACVSCAFTLYRRILDEFERAGYPLDRRVRVSRTRRVAVAGPGVVRALWARARAKGAASATL